jgi:DNA-binding CsgD family transcriptional regulator
MNQEDKILFLLKKGKNKIEIAKILDRRYQTIIKVCKRLGK